MAALASKKISEVITVSFDFRSTVRFGETLSSPVVTVAILSGADFSPSDILSGAASQSGGVVSQTIVQGMPGVIYNLICTVDGSTGSVYVKTLELAVLTDEGSYQPGSTLTLTGDLPDGIVGAAYSAPLTISGGYIPYAPDGIASGAAPAWMGFTVVDDELICAGLPDEPAATSYTFAPNVTDAALTDASSPQTINISRILVSGNHPDMNVGDNPVFSYTIDSGTAPYTASLARGSLPTGRVLNSDGSVTGEATTVGSYSWTVMGTDANGITTLHPDDAVVSNVAWITMINGGAFNGYLMDSSDGEVWNTPQAVSIAEGGSWSPSGVGTLLHQGGRVLGLSASANVGAAPNAFYDTDNQWHSVSMSAGTGSLQTIYIDGYWWAARTTGGGVVVASDGRTFANTGLTLESITPVLGNSLVLGAYATGSSFDLVIFLLRNPDGTSSGTPVPDLNTGYECRSANLGSDGTTVCMLLREGSANPYSIRVLSSSDAGQTWIDHGTPFPTYATIPDAADKHVHYNSELGWFVFSNDRVAMGSSPASLSLDPIVFPGNVRGVGSSGTKLICCGQGGMLYKYTPGGGWEPLSSGNTGSLMDITPVEDWP